MSGTTTRVLIVVHRLEFRPSQTTYSLPFVHTSDRKITPDRAYLGGDCSIQRNSRSSTIRMTTATGIMIKPAKS